MNYIGGRANRIIIGDYDYENNSYLNSKIIQPPTNTTCEKNWIPILLNQQMHFIYKWNPFQLSKINDENNLEIIESHEILSPNFYRIRGSTVFIDQGDYLVGVVHFCEESTPRKYYHVLVHLNKETGLPQYYSDPFCFQHIGVEFCIGFTIKEDKYIFWISKKDNDAIMVKINTDEIPICSKVLY